MQVPESGHLPHLKATVSQRGAVNGLSSCCLCFNPLVGKKNLKFHPAGKIHDHSFYHWNSYISLTMPKYYQSIYVTFYFTLQYDRSISDCPQIHEIFFTNQVFKQSHLSNHKVILVLQNAHKELQHGLYQHKLRKSQWSYVFLSAPTIFWMSMNWNF